MALKSVTFGKGRRLLIALNVTVVALLALLVWGALNVVATRPALKVVVDSTAQQRLSLSDATRQLLARLRADPELKVEIHTFYERHLPQSDPAQIQPRLVQMTRDLLSLYAHAGGDQLVVRDHDIYGDIAGSREVMQALQTRDTHTVVIKLGKKKRVLGVWQDLGDIEFPGAGQGGPVQSRLPILRGYKGEEAITSAIQGMLEQGTVIAYFTKGHHEPGLRDTGTLGLGRLMLALADLGIESRELDLKQSPQVPESAAMVAVVEPDLELGAEAENALEQYLKRGGNLLISSSATGIRAPPRLEGLSEFLGVVYGTRLLGAAFQDPGNPDRVGVGSREVLNVRVTQVNPQHQATRDIVSRASWPLLKMCRQIKPREKAEGVIVEPLLTTMTGFEMDIQPGTLEPTYQPDPGKAPGAFHVGLAITGSKGDKPFKAAVLTGLPLAGGGIDADNRDLALGVFKWLTERTRLVSVPTRNYESRRLDLVEGQYTRIRWLLIGGVPGVLLVGGLIVLYLRKRA